MGPLEVVAAALAVWGKYLDIYTAMLQKATPDQAAKLIQLEIDRESWWPNLIDKLTPKGPPA
jgi:hypothetical protein